MTDEVHRHVFTLNSRESLASWTGDSFVDTSLALAFHHVMEGLAVIPRLEQVHYFPTDPHVQYRFDTDEASPIQRWEQLGSASAYLRGDEGLPEFLGRARTATHVLMRITDPYDGQTVTAEFSLNGVNKALSELPEE